MGASPRRTIATVAEGVARGPRADARARRGRSRDDMTGIVTVKGAKVFSSSNFASAFRLLC